MFDSQILDIAIALSFTYFLLGLIVSSVNEIMMMSLKKRNKILEYAIRNLLFDDHWKGIAGKIIDSPFIQSLKKNNAHFPAYIPAKNFALAVLDTIRGGDTGLLTTGKIREILAAENSPVKGETKRILLGLLDLAEDNFSNFQASLEKFYDDAMERAGGWYKKEIQKWLFFISFGITVILNVDTIQITKTLWQDPSLAQKTTDLITENIKQINVDSLTGTVIIKGETGQDTLGRIFIQDIDSAVKDSGDEGRTIERKIKSIKKITATLKEIPFPMGWVKGNYPSCNEKCFDLFWDWVFKFFGWIITAAALFLGSPFWFDLLSKFVNMRVAGKKPIKSGEEIKLKK